MTFTRKMMVLAAVPALLLTVTAAPASAHGYVSTPMSRQAQCMSSGGVTPVVPCGDIQYEPQSVEGPKGLHSCDGGLDKFKDLSDDGKPWKAAKVGTSVAFTWTFTVRHATRDYQYFIGDKLLRTVDAGGKAPEGIVTHTVDLSGYTGKQKLLAVWNIADTPMAFYNCVDLEVGAAAPAAVRAPAAKSFWRSVSDFWKSV
ncbi:chitin-binding protein [Pseudonocardiaceae bacterium YIM PH 21723]|nr:chitin-binding protein [Pseudonocardiaceae bacterium YIM PH 21723]